MTDILYQTLQDLPKDLCPGLENAALTFNGKNYERLTNEVNACLNKVTTEISDALPFNVTNYITLNYPNPNGYANNFTSFQGVRGVVSSRDIYISGTFGAQDQESVGIIYKGSVQGQGTWYTLLYPSSNGITVNSTSIYGPNNGDSIDTIQAVGSYQTVETGTHNLGFLYQGPLDGTGTWKTLNPQSIDKMPVQNTIPHSTMGGIVVGNFNNPDAALAGRAFIYNIQNDSYSELLHPNAQSTTAYGIWHNGGSSYTITGGAQTRGALPHAYIVNWDSLTKTASGWEFFFHENDILSATFTHSEGIAIGRNGHFALSTTIIEGESIKASYAQTTDNYTIWSDFVYPGSRDTTANTVYENHLLGVYTTGDSHITNGYIVTFD